MALAVDSMPEATTHRKTMKPCARKRCIILPQGAVVPKLALIPPEVSGVPPLVQVVLVVVLACKTGFPMPS